MSVWAVIGKILLIILKVLGWTVVGILGLILLILLIVFFFPILYKVEASGEGKDIQAAAKVHTLLRLVSADVKYQDKKAEGVLRIAWIRKQLFGGEKPEEEPPPEPKESAAEAIAAEDEKPEPEKPEAAEPAGEDKPAAEEAPKAETHEEPPKVEEAPKAEETPKEEEPPKAEEAEETSEPEIIEPTPEPEYEYILTSALTGREIRIDDSNPLVAKVLLALEAAENKVDGVSDKVDETIQSIEEKVFKVESLYHTFIDYPDRPYLTHLLLKQLRKILRNLRPSVLRLYAIYGLESPVTTGKIAGVLGMLSGMSYGSRRCDVALTPDFEEKTLAGSFLCKGHLQTYMILFPILRLAFCPKVWKLIKFIRKK